jgi:hypothetical protein
MPPPRGFLLTSLQMCPLSLSLSLWLAPLFMGVISNKVPSLSPLTQNPHVACCVPVVGDLLHTCVNAQLNKKSHDITQTFGCIPWEWLHHMSIILLQFQDPTMLRVKGSISLEGDHHVASCLMMLCKKRFIRNYTKYYATTQGFPPHKPPNVLSLSLCGWLIC